MRVFCKKNIFPALALSMTWRASDKGRLPDITAMASSLSSVSTDMVTGDWWASEEGRLPGFYSTSFSTDLLANVTVAPVSLEWVEDARLLFTSYSLLTTIRYVSIVLVSLARGGGCQTPLYELRPLYHWRFFTWWGSDEGRLPESSSPAAASSPLKILYLVRVGWGEAARILFSSCSLLTTHCPRQLSGSLLFCKLSSIRVKIWTEPTENPYVQFNMRACSSSLLDPDKNTLGEYWMHVCELDVAMNKWIFWTSWSCDGQHLVRTIESKNSLSNQETWPHTVSHLQGVSTVPTHPPPCPHLLPRLPGEAQVTSG